MPIPEDFSASGIVSRMHSNSYLCQSGLLVISFFHHCSHCKIILHLYKFKSSSDINRNISLYCEILEFIFQSALSNSRMLDVMPFSFPLAFNRETLLI